MLISALLFEGPEAALVVLAAEGRFEALACDYVVEQVRRVLQTKFDFSPVGAAELLATLPLSVTGDPAASLVELAADLVRDVTDAPVLAGAWEARVDALVSGDKDLLSLGPAARVTVLRTREVMAFLEGGPDS